MTDVPRDVPMDFCRLKIGPAYDLGHLGLTAGPGRVMDARQIAEVNAALDEAARLQARVTELESQLRAAHRDAKEDDGFYCLECRLWRCDADAENHAQHLSCCSRYQPPTETQS